MSQEAPEEDIEQTMDRFFGGILRSDVVCASCGYTSTAHDPFKDISVDILQPPHPKPPLPAVGVPKPNPVSASKSAAKSNKSGGKGTDFKLPHASIEFCKVSENFYINVCSGLQHMLHNLT